MTDLAVAENDSNEVETPQADSGKGLDVVVETNTYAVFKTPGKDGKPDTLGFGVLKEGNKLSKQVENAEVELILKSDVSIPYAQTVAGIKQVIPDDDEIVTVFNNGATSKVTTRIRSYFMEQNEAGDFVHADETAFDASEFLSEPMKRKTLTDSQKIVKALSGVSKADLAEALKAMGILI